MKGKLSNILTGFQKGHSEKHSFLIMIKKQKKT